MMRGDQESNPEKDIKMKQTDCSLEEVSAPLPRRLKSYFFLETIFEHLLASFRSGIGKKKRKERTREGAMPFTEIGFLGSVAVFGE